MTEPPAEQEIDLRRYWDAIAARAWLPVAGVFAGAVLGYAISLGGSDVWRAQALVYLGQPLTPTGAQLQTLSTNPTTVPEIVRSRRAQRDVASAVGMSRSELAKGISVQQVKGSVTRLGQNPLVRVGVKGGSRFKVQAAANLLARTVVNRVSDYADAKIQVLEQEIDAGEQELAQIDAQIARANRVLPRLSGAEQLSALAQLGFVVQRRGELRQDLLTAKQNLVLAQRVERGRVVEQAIARKTTAQSRRNQIVVGALLGLLAGLVAALGWESAAALRRR